MLVLTRRQDEEVVIGDDIIVKVLEIRGNTVRIGFVAPAQVAVHRKEVYDEIAQANRMAACVSPEDVASLQR